MAIRTTPLPVKFRVVEVYKRRPDNNPLSNSAFEEYGDPIAYEVKGPFGVESKHKTIEKAEEACKKQQEFYDKFFPEGL